MRILNPETLSAPRGYNQGLLSESGVLFISGQVGWDRNEKLADGLVNQFELALRNILEVVRTAGGHAEDIGRFTIYIKDKEQYILNRKEIGARYRSVMGKHFPAMSLLVVKDLLEDGALVEIEATAVLR